MITSQFEIEYLQAGIIFALQEKDNGNTSPPVCNLYMVV